MISEVGEAQNMRRHSVIQSLEAFWTSWAECATAGGTSDWWLSFLSKLFLLKKKCLTALHSFNKSVVYFHKSNKKKIPHITFNQNISFASFSLHSSCVGI